jgi:DNA primase
VIMVEGLFDALSLALYGFNAIATVGRLAHWLPDACAGKTVILAFDGNKPGDAAAAFYKEFLICSKTFRLTPPRHSKDWNTALQKNSGITHQWIDANLSRYMQKTA